jgi:hypothetical protein
VLFALAVPIVLAVLAASCTNSAEQRPSPNANPTGTPSGTALGASASSRGPSQSPAEADRDGVARAIAALPFDVRVEPLSTVRVDGRVWVISRPRAVPPNKLNCANDASGDISGVGPICAGEYGELLLLDRRGTKIVRALPLPTVPPQHLAATDDAAYCGRAGDGGLPHSMVCRMDARTFETTVRIFWDEDNTAQPPKPDLQPGWILHDEYLPMYAFRADDDAVWAKDRYDGDTWTKLDPVTLAIVAEKVERPPD